MKSTGSAVLHLAHFPSFNSLGCETLYQEKLVPLNSGSGISHILIQETIATKKSSSGHGN
jgi:hypothetical protein